MNKRTRKMILGLVGATMLVLATGCSNTDDTEKENDDKSEEVEKETPSQDKIVVTDELREKFEYEYLPLFDEEEEVSESFTDGELKDLLVDKAIEEGFEYLQVGHREITLNEDGKFEGFIEGGVSTFEQLELMETSENFEEVMGMEVTIYEATIKDSKLDKIIFTQETIAEQLDAAFNNKDDEDEEDEEDEEE